MSNEQSGDDQHTGDADEQLGAEPDAGRAGPDQNENPERQGPGPAWRPTDEPDPNDPDRDSQPPPESAPGDSGEVSTPRR